MLKRKWSFMRRHYDFIIIDLIAFVLGYLVAMLFRQSLHLDFNNQKLFFSYEVTAVVSFLLVEISTEYLNGVITRGLVKETVVTVKQMSLTWAVFLSLLFLLHIIYGISRIFTVASYLICTTFVLVFRISWRMLCKYTKLSNSTLPKLLIITEGNKAQLVLNRLLSGSYSNEYDIAGIVVTGKIEGYRDWYPIEVGLEKIEIALSDRRIQEAYVELEDAGDEKKVIEKLLSSGIIVHRSLGESGFAYSRQRIGEINRKSVITIHGNTASLVSRADRIWQSVRTKLRRAA